MDQCRVFALHPTLAVFREFGVNKDFASVAGINICKFPEREVLESGYIRDGEMTFDGTAGHFQIDSITGIDFTERRTPDFREAGFDGLRTVEDQFLSRRGIG